MLKKNDNFLIKEISDDVTLPFIRHTVDTSECIFVCHNVKWRLIDILQIIAIIINIHDAYFKVGLVK